MPASRKPKTKKATPPAEELVVNLRILCRAPLRAADYGAEFGLQDNSSTTHWALTPGMARSDGDLQFDFEARVRPHPRTGEPTFLGNYVHGPTDGRFAYLSWRPAGCRLSQLPPNGPGWVRRMKVHLRSITWAQIRQAVKTGGVLEAAVEGVGRDGGPNCASVPLLGDGWILRQA